jgi:DNA-binding transcriptional MocR family regulator
MPLSTRQTLVRLARKHDALIITDDVYDFLKWRTSSSPVSSMISPNSAAIPRLVDIDRTLSPQPETNGLGNVVSNGSFSKIVAPGARTGWAEGTPKFTDGLSKCGSSASGGAPSQMVATFLCEMLKNGVLQHHIEAVLCPAYQKRYTLIYKAIHEHLLPLGLKLGETSFGDEKLFGGYFVWLELPDDLLAKDVREVANDRENLIIGGGDLFEVHGDKNFKFGKSIRLCFAWEQEENISEGVQRLARAIKRILPQRRR